MKKFILLALCLVFVMAMAVAPVMAIDMNITLGAGSNVNTSWAGVNDVFNLDVNLGPSRFALTNAGVTFDGIANLSNAGGNPYGYNVPSTSAFVSANFSGGGLTTYNFTRTDSYIPMYGPAGQFVMAGVQSDDGTGNMALTINTNYASLGVGNYSQPNVPGGGQFYATGSNFGIVHSVADGAGNGAGFNLTGSGSARINAMSSDVGGSSFNFGAGQGCYTNATIATTGSGSLILGGAAANYLNAPGFGTTLYGGGNFQAAANYNAGLNVANFSINGH